MVEFVKKNKKRKNKILFKKLKQRFLLSCLACGFLGLVYAFTLGGAVSHLTNKFYEISASNGFALETVTLSGYKNLDEDFIESKIQIPYGKSIFAVNATNLAENFNELSATEHLEVSRILPNQINIKIIERKPLAISYEERGKYKYIDEHGVKFTYGKKIDPSEENYIIVASGDAKKEKIAAILKMLKANPSLAEQVQLVQKISNRRWDLKLFSGATIKLPEENFASVINNFMADSNRSGLLNLQPKYIDLRDEKKIYVGPLLNQETQI